MLTARNCTWGWEKKSLGIAGIKVAEWLKKVADFKIAERSIGREFCKSCEQPEFDSRQQRYNPSLLAKHFYEKSRLSF